MKTGAQSSLPKLEQEILGYLLRNPSGEDSIEGIVEWWLLEQRIMQAKYEVSQALEALHQRGFIESRTAGSGRTVFRLNHQNRRAAQAALEKIQRTRGSAP